MGVTVNDMIRYEKSHDPYASQWLRRNRVISLRHTYVSSDVSWDTVLCLAARDRKIDTLRSLVKALEPVQKYRKYRKYRIPSFSIQISKKSGNRICDVPEYFNLHQGIDQLPSNHVWYAVNFYYQLVRLISTDTMHQDGCNVFVKTESILWGPVYRIAIEYIM